MSISGIDTRDDYKVMIISQNEERLPMEYSFKVFENAEIELKLMRFFVESDYCEYKSPLDPFKYAPDELWTNLSTKVTKVLYKQANYCLFKYTLVTFSVFYGLAIG